MVVQWLQLLRDSPGFNPLQKLMQTNVLGMNNEASDNIQNFTQILKTIERENVNTLI